MIVQYNFVTSKQWSKQSYALDKSVKKALKLLPISTASSNILIRIKRQCYMLYPFRNPHWLWKVYCQNTDEVDCALVFHAL